MNFKKWIVNNGLSESSAKKYESAINGSISGWALEAGIIDEPLTNFDSKDQFQAVLRPIRELDIFQKRDAVGNNMYSSALKRFGEYLEDISDDIEKDLDDVLSDDTISETECKSLIKSRVGQGEFRDKLISKWGGCAVTGYPKIKLLRASHIKPWKDSDNEERLSKHNGFLLLPNLDKAFDSGFITFRNSGKIQISEEFDEPALFGVESSMKIELDENHKHFLEYHRDTVFES